MAKGLSEITTAALYVGITITAISAALTVGVPVLENMQDAAAISNAQTLMETLDGQIDEVVSEGEGSTRTVDVNLDRGQLYFDNSTNALIYELRTDAEVISPQSSRRNGNIILSSNARVTVEKNETLDCYMMENDHIKACIRDVGGPDDYDDIDTSNLLVLYEFKNPDGENKQLEGNMTVKLNDRDETSHGTGYTTAPDTGHFIGTGEVVATVEKDEDFSYDVHYRLPTGSDFLRVDVRNFR